MRGGDRLVFLFDWLNTHDDIGVHLFDAFDAVPNERVFEFGDTSLQRESHTREQLQQEESRFILDAQVCGVEGKVPDCFDPLQIPRVYMHVKVDVLICP